MELTEKRLTEIAEIQEREAKYILGHTYLVALIMLLVQTSSMERSHENTKILSLTITMTTDLFILTT